MTTSLKGLMCLLGMPLLAQCSDAGVCALERIPDAARRRISILGQYGRSGAPDDLTFQSLRIEGAIPLSDRTGLTFTVPFGRVRGPRGSTSGLGDAILVLERPLAAGPWGRLLGQLGARLPTGRDDAGGLPQRYQVGLGSVDALLGARWESDAWEAGLGYQKAGRPSGNTVEAVKRGDDQLVHLGGRTRLGSLQTRLKVVAIQRLRESEVREGNGPFRALAHSDRLQVNVVGGLSLPLAQRWSLDSRLALPLLQRPDNTDGLKRALTVELGASFRF